MRKKGFVCWPAVCVLALSLVFAVSCAKEGLRGTPGQPSLKKEAYPEKGDLSKEDRIIWDAATATADKEWADRMDKEIAALKAQHAKEMAMMTAHELKDQFETEKTYFAYDSADLTWDAKVVLIHKAQYMTEQDPAVKLLVEGHCDERGSVEYNLALGQRRAESAQRYLARAGVAKDRLRVVSYGKERPVDMGHDEDAWSKNRRCEFVSE